MTNDHQEEMIKLMESVNARLSNIENDMTHIKRTVAEMSGGLAMVLGRSGENKKKLLSLQSGYKGWLSELLADLHS